MDGPSNSCVREFGRSYMTLVSQWEKGKPMMSSRRARNMKTFMEEYRSDAWRATWKQLVNSLSMRAAVSDTYLHVRSLPNAII